MTTQPDPERAQRIWTGIHEVFQREVGASDTDTDFMLSALIGLVLEASASNLCTREDLLTLVNQTFDAADAAQRKDLDND